MSEAQKFIKKVEDYIEGKSENITDQDEKFINHSGISGGGKIWDSMGKKGQTAIKILAGALAVGGAYLIDEKGFSGRGRKAVMGVFGKNPAAAVLQNAPTSVGPNAPLDTPVNVDGPQQQQQQQRDQPS
ncbi:MAG: hypothetical protein LBR79_06325 [Oscillospiraceae bacterium]|jgi:hypothetical protein|nr:hypothetical protein [Oscillospiraceae bacterium]